MTATTKFLAGSAFNLMGRGLVYVSDEDENYLRAGLYDDDPAVPYRAADIREDGWIKVDLNQVRDPADDADVGGFEVFNGNFPKGWTPFTTGGGALGVALFPHSGAMALSCGVSASGGSAGVAMEITARAGETLTLNTWMMSATGGGIARVRIQNKRTGKYLAKGGWQVAPTDCQTETAPTAYVNHVKTFTVEGYDACQADEVTLALRLYTDTTGGVVYFDDVYLYPGVNFFSMHGHNIEPRISVLWQYSATDTAVEAPAPYTLISSHTAKEPSFYGVTAATLYQRWIQFTFSGTPLAAPVSVGELVLGQTQTLLTDARHPALADWQWDYLRPQVRNKRQDGGERPFNLNDHPQRTLRLPYLQTSDASFEQFRQEVRRRCQDGAEPIVLVPDDSRPEVLFGRVPAEWTDRQSILRSVHATDLVVVESPFGLSGL